MDFYSSSFLLSGATFKDWMIDLVYGRTAAVVPASYTSTPKRVRDLSIHDTWIIWRLVFLPSLIYRGVIIRRSQRRRRRRSCITILYRALHPQQRTKSSTRPGRTWSSPAPPPAAENIRNFVLLWLLSRITATREEVRRQENVPT